MELQEVYGDTAKGTSVALNEYTKGPVAPIKAAQSISAGPRVFGLQADVTANPDKNVNLYISGKTQLTAQDVPVREPHQLKKYIDA